MSELRIQIPDDGTAFEPGGEVGGTVYWKLDAAVGSVELRLFWFTRGKGTEDACVVDRVRFETPRAEESTMFRFKLPDSPYSFSGKLISLVWALELVTEPAKEVQRLELIVAPGGREVRLASLPDARLKMNMYQRRNP